MSTFNSVTIEKLDCSSSFKIRFCAAMKPRLCSISTCSSIGLRCSSTSTAHFSGVFFSQTRRSPCANEDSYKSFKRRLVPLLSFQVQDFCENRTYTFLHNLLSYQNDISSQSQANKATNELWTCWIFPTLPKYIGHWMVRKIFFPFFQKLAWQTTQGLEISWHLLAARLPRFTSQKAKRSGIRPTSKVTSGQSFNDPSGILNLSTPEKPIIVPKYFQISPKNRSSCDTSENSVCLSLQELTFRCWTCWGRGVF